MSRKCEECGGKLVAIDNRRLNGKDHDDWDTRKYHKKCWIKIQKGEDTDTESDSNWPEDSYGPNWRNRRSTLDGKQCCYNGCNGELCTCMDCPLCGKDRSAKEYMDIYTGHCRQCDMKMFFSETGRYAKVR